MIFQEKYFPCYILLTDYITLSDLRIKIEYRKFDIQLYDKRADFPFSLVRMSHHTSNIPSKMSYSAIGAEIGI